MKEKLPRGSITTDTRWQVYRHSPLCPKDRKVKPRREVRCNGPCMALAAPARKRLAMTVAGANLQKLSLFLHAGPTRAVSSTLTHVQHRGQLSLGAAPGRELTLCIPSVWLFCSYSLTVPTIPLSCVTCLSPSTSPGTGSGALSHWTLRIDGIPALSSPGLLTSPLSALSGH